MDDIYKFHKYTLSGVVFIIRIFLAVGIFLSI